MAKIANLRTGYLIKRAELVVRTKLEVAMRDLGLTPGQYTALSLLSAMPETSSAQLAREIGVTPQTMAETIMTFEKGGLIHREPSSTHKRVLKISLTPKGKALLKTCEARASKAESALFVQLSESQIGELRATLQTVLRSGDDA